MCTCRFTGHTNFEELFDWKKLLLLILLLSSCRFDFLRHNRKNSLVFNQTQTTDIRTHFAFWFRWRRIQNCEKEKVFDFSAVEGNISLVKKTYPNASNDRIVLFAWFVPSYASSRSSPVHPNSFCCLHVQMSCLSTATAWMVLPAVVVFPQNSWNWISILLLKKLESNGRCSRGQGHSTATDIMSNGNCVCCYFKYDIFTCMLCDSDLDRWAPRIP